jgi:hypothetical protein
MLTEPGATLSQFAGEAIGCKRLPNDVVIEMEDPRCKIVVIEMDDLRCRSSLNAVVIEIEDLRCKSLLNRVVLEIEDPSCESLLMTWWLRHQMGHRYPHIKQVNHAPNYGRPKMCDNYSKNNYL